MGKTMTNAKTSIIWLDGEFIPASDANTNVLTHTLHYGLGVFEGLRAYKTPAGSAIFRLECHTQRLYRSAKIMGIEIPYDYEQLVKAQIQAVLENELTDAYIRPMCFYGDEALGLHSDGAKVHVMIAAWHWGMYLGRDVMESGIRVGMSSYQRNSICSSHVKAKANGNYVNSQLAIREAKAAGYDEALMCDHQGFIAEGSVENFFMVRDGVLYTPFTTSALEGITRDTIMQLARNQGIVVKEKNMIRDDVYIADEAFFTGSAAEVTPIREIDGRCIGSGKRGPITEKLQTLYLNLVHGQLHDYEHWLTRL